MRHVRWARECRPFVVGSVCRAVVIAGGCCEQRCGRMLEALHGRFRVSRCIVGQMPLRNLSCVASHCELRFARVVAGHEASSASKKTRAVDRRVARSKALEAMRWRMTLARVVRERRGKGLHVNAMPCFKCERTAGCVGCAGAVGVRGEKALVGSITRRFGLEPACARVRKTFRIMMRRPCRSGDE